jgi:hypothetical protein
MYDAISSFGQKMRDTFRREYKDWTVPELKKELKEIAQTQVHAPTQLSKMKYEIIEKLIFEKTNTIK